MQTVLPFTARCYSFRYFPIAANEPEVSPIGLLPWNDSYQMSTVLLSESHTYSSVFSVV